MGLELLVSAADSLQKTEGSTKFTGTVHVQKQTFKYENHLDREKPYQKKLTNKNIKVNKQHGPQYAIASSNYSFPTYQKSFQTKTTLQKESGKSFSIERLMSNEGSPVNSSSDSPLTTENKNNLKSDKAKAYYESLLKKYPKEVVDEILALNNLNKSCENDEKEEEWKREYKNSNDDANISSDVENKRRKLSPTSSSTTPPKAVAEVKPFDATVTKMTLEQYASTISTSSSTTDEYTLSNFSSMSFLKKIEKEMEHKSQSASFGKFCENILEPGISEIKIPNEPKEAVENEASFPDDNGEKNRDSKEKAKIRSPTLTQIFLPTPAKTFLSTKIETSAIKTSPSFYDSNDLKISNPFSFHTMVIPSSPQSLFARPTSIPTSVLLNTQRDSPQKKMIQEKLNQQDEDGDTMLHIAIAQENIRLAKSIIMKMNQAGLNMLNRSGQAAIHIASYLDMVEAVQELLLHGADGCIVDKEGNTALHIACSKDYERLAELLIDWSNKNPKNIELLCKRNNRGMAPIHIAVERGNNGLVNSLAKYSHSVDVQEQKCGETALLMAMRMSKWDIAEVLIDNKADVNIPSFAGMYPLYYPTLAAKVELVTRMAQLGATPGKPKEWGESTKIHTSMKKVLDKEMRKQRRKRKGVDSPEFKPEY